MCLSDIISASSNSTKQFPVAAMNDHRLASGSSTSKSRTANFKSPSSHEGLDARTYKRKYEKKVQQLLRERQRSKELEELVEEMRLKLQKQEKELQKKEQIEDVLLMQINQLKSQVESNKSLSKQNSLEEKRSLHSLKVRQEKFKYYADRGLEQNQQRSRDKEFSSVCQGSEFESSSNFQNASNQNKEGPSGYHSQSQNSLQKSLSSQGSRGNGGGNTQVGGYFGSIFSK